MRKIVVDTNVVFSAILNTNNKIGDLLLNSNGLFEYYTTTYLKEEIEKHNSKLLEISGLTQKEIEESKNQILKNINFYSEDQIPFEIWYKSAQLVRDVDMDDIAFVAMSEHLDCKLWTGDKELMKGLISKGFTRTISTQELYDLRVKLENESR